MKKVKRLDSLIELRIDEVDGGYLSGTAIIARSGVQTYTNPDGSMRKEYRPPSEVSKIEHLDSIKMIPITNGHPSGGFVNSSNASKLSIGTTGESVSYSDNVITSSIKITHKDGINAVKAGRKGLSLGYELELEYAPGVTESGEEYEYIQRNMKANHLAIVDKPRAGAIARLNVDGDVVLDDNIDNSLQEDEKNNKGEKMPTMNVDGFEREASPEVIKYAQEIKNELESLKSEKTKLEARADSLEDELKSLKESNSEEVIAGLVKSRLELLSKAGRFDGVDSSTLVEKSDTEIMLECLKSRKTSINLDGKSEDYIAAAFDIALDGMKEEKSKKVSDSASKILAREDGFSHNVARNDGRGRVAEFKEAYKKGDK